MGALDEKTTDPLSPTALNGFLCPTSEADLGYFGGSAAPGDVWAAQSPSEVVLEPSWGVRGGIRRWLGLLGGGRCRAVGHAGGGGGGYVKVVYADGDSHYHELLASDYGRQGKWVVLTPGEALL